MISSAQTRRLERLVHSSRTHLWPGDHLSDAELLTHFTEQHDARAFEVLVRRHGPMVRRVARRALADDHAAEDVLQATFLVLARQARSVRQPESVGSWLHGVAHRLSRRAHRDSLRRTGILLPDRPAPPDPLAEISARELQGVLDEELFRLPHSLRTPLVLCYLEGLTRDQAARRLGWSVRTLKRRLREGKESLRRRLERRGFTLSAVLLPGALGPTRPCPAEAITRAALNFAGRSAGCGAPASPSAVALAEGAVSGLGLVKAKVAAVVALVLLLVGIGMGALLGPASPDAPSKGKPQPGAKPPPTEPDSPPLLATRIEGEAELAAGLKWLARLQGLDGHWNIGRLGDEKRAAATALGLLPFLRVGQTHEGEGALHPHAPVVRRGLQALLKVQKADGGFEGTMYGQALATWALAEAYVRSRDAKLRVPAQQAVDFIVRAQHEQGGWRYRPGQPGDTSVTTWQILALGAARRAGLKVPEATSRKVRAYLESAHVADGGFSYLPAVGRSKPSMTAAGLFGLLELGTKPDDVRVPKALALLAKHPPSEELNDVYYYHFATRAHEGAGGEAWRKWQAAMRRRLSESQERATGSWDDSKERITRSAGRLVMTSLCLLTLEVCVQSPQATKGVRPPGSAKEAEAYYRALGTVNFLEARRLVEALAAAPDLTQAVLKKELRPLPPVEARELARLIQALDDDTFTVRQEAEAELKRLGERAEPALRKELTGRPSLEMQRRIEHILDAISPDQSPQRRRRLLGQEVLRRIGG